MFVCCDKYLKIFIQAICSRSAALPADEHVGVVVLTTSSAPVDVNRMDQLGCNSYLAKPGDFGVLAAALKQLAGY